MYISSEFPSDSDAAGWNYTENHWHRPSLEGIVQGLPLHYTSSVCVCVCVRERESVAQSHQTFCNTMVARFLSMEFSRQEFWSELPFPSPGDLPNSEIEPRSPTLQADSLPAKPPGNPIYPFCIIVNVLPVACLICSNDYLEFMFLDT